MEYRPDQSIELQQICVPLGGSLNLGVDVYAEADVDVDVPVMAMVTRQDLT